MKIKLRTSKAFTLVELLVTIAIIAILAALCMAVVNRTRVKTYEAQDVTSLRQLGAAYHLMMNELSEVRPNDFFDPSDKLYAYTSDSYNESAAWEDRVTKTAAARKLLSSDYWRKLNAGKLPSNELYPRSYSVNQTFFPMPPPESDQPNWERLAVPPSQILLKNDMVLLFMTYAGGTPGIAYMGAANPIYSGINKSGYGSEYGRTPLLFVDGHCLVADMSREYNNSTNWGD